MKLSKRASLLLGVALLFSCVYFVYAYFTLPPTHEVHSFWGEVGGGFGNVAFWGLGLLYCRGVVKLLVKKGPWLERIVSPESTEAAVTLGQQVLKLLNKTHPLLGIVTIALLAVHAGLTSSSQLNLLLLLTMVVVFWQGGFGLFLKTRAVPLTLRKYSHAVHAQLVTGGLILIFAGFGHLLIGG